MGLTTDEQPEAVEVFYEELRADVEDALIAELRPDYEHVLLEALEPSAEVLARMRKKGNRASAEGGSARAKVVNQPTLWDV